MSEEKKKRIAEAIGAMEDEIKTAAENAMDRARQKILRLLDEPEPHDNACLKAV